MKFSKKAFTLIELLVVISIIAILMSIMMPALRKARAQAMSIVCSSQQKDIGLALNLYSQDWKGVLPRAYWAAGSGTNYTRLPYKLSPYYDTKITTSSADAWSYKLFSCPSQPKILSGENNQPAERGNSAVGSYGYNKFFFYGLIPYKNAPLKDYVERNTYDIKDASTLPLLCCISGEKYDGLGGGGGQVMDFEGVHPKAFKYGFMGGKSASSVARTRPSGPAPNHGKNCNMLMADFHVEPVNVCVDGKYPWTDYTGTSFHPSRASKRGYDTK